MGTFSLAYRRLMDQHLAQIGRLLEGQDFAPIEEANALLQQAIIGGTFLPLHPAPRWKRRRKTPRRMI